MECWGRASCTTGTKSTNRAIATATTATHFRFVLFFTVPDSLWFDIVLDYRTNRLPYNVWD